MAIKDILVHLDTSERGDAVAQFALSLAIQMNSHVTAAGLAVQVLPPASFMGEYPYDIMREATDAARTAADEAFKTLRQGAPAGIEMEMVMIEAPPAEARNEFGRLGRHFDLTVVGQGGSETTSEDELMAEGALFHSGRPVFIVPRIHTGPAKLETAMVCWDGGLQAARALANALPFLKRAQKVELVRIDTAGAPVDEAPAFDITRHLGRHGISASLRKAPAADDLGAALLSHAADSGSDFIVMGAYSHSRLFEFVMGGTTRTLLNSMTVPVLMAH